MKKNRIILIVLITVASLIYFFSSMPYEEQSLIPYLEENLPHEWLEENFSWVEVNYAGSIINIDSYGTAHFVEFFIRKAAHVGIFATLAVCLFLFVSKWFKKSISFVVSLLITSSYAALDELHQKATGGRSPMWQDVVLDTVGALLGLVMLMVILKFLRKRRECK